MPYKNLELELENLLSAAVESGASDLHLIPGHHPIVRVDSKLIALEDHAILTPDDVKKLVELKLSENRLKSLAEHRDIDFSFSFRNDHRFRGNAYFQKGSLALALRYIPKEVQSLEDLNLPPVLKKFADRKQGLVLIVGPTGHGKSTTVSALLDYINKTRYEHIITIEDPIEHIFTPHKSYIQQREVGQDAATFARAIRATMREDANVVMIGEMRDPESIAAAITVAETGHLVFATLHTNDAPQTIDRIVDTFPAHQQQQIRTQLASILTGIISLRLINKIGGGRIPAIETLFINDAAKNLIRENKTYEIINVIHTGSQDDMISLDQSLANLVNKKLVQLEDARPYVQYQEIFQSRLGSNSPGSF